MTVITAPPPPPAAGPLEWPALAARARAETRLSDFGDEAEFRPALERLLAAWREEAGLDEAGQRRAWTRALGALKNRLWTESCLRAHPEIDAAPLAAPLVLIGAPGSGAAWLQRLLACDTRLAHLRTWEGLNPAPRMLPAWPPHAPDVEARRQEAQAETLCAEADAPADDMLLLDQQFAGLTPLALYDLPGWWRWFAQADHAAAYRALARQIKLVAWTRGDAPGQRWLLRSPQHMLHLPSLMAVFPQAKLVFVNRDPQVTMDRTVAALSRVGAPHRGRASVQETVRELFETAARRCSAERAAIAPALQLDLQHGEIESDWRAAFDRVQSFAGLSPDAEADAALQDCLASAMRRSAREPR